MLYRVAQKNNTENMSNIYNELNTCIRSKCKSLLSYWKIQLLALIIMYLMSLHDFLHSYFIYVSYL